MSARLMQTWRLGLLLVAAALFMRALLPAGMMPETERGSIAVKICGSGGVHLIPLKPAPAPDEDSDRGEPPCAFAGVAVPALPASAPAVSPVLMSLRAAFAEVPDARPRAGQRRARPPARGPPQPA